MKSISVKIIRTGLAEIEINRPNKLNALNSLVLSELVKVFTEIDYDERIQVIILRGSGDKAFVAGADIEEMSQMGSLEFREYTMNLRRLGKQMTGMEKIVIGAVKGYAFGGGNIIAMNCDLVFASESSTFGQQEINLGILGGVARLIYLIGARRAWDLILTGRTINSKEAESIGLINKCLPDDQFNEFVIEYAENLLKHPVMTLRLAKKLKSMSEKVNLESAYEYENELISLCFSSNDTKKLLKSFVK
jgi:enoyl-CoA hydratase